MSKPLFDPPLTGTNLAEPEKKRGFLRRAWPYAAVAVAGLVLGAMLGSSATSVPPGAAQPAPAQTVTVEVPGPADTTCKEVAYELMDMLNEMTHEVAIPQNEATMILVDAFSTFDVSEIERATAIVQGVTAATESLTARTLAIDADYTKCTNP
jgi:hypothetical protein